MTSEEALALLELNVGASERQIRSQLFRRYQSLTTNLAELEDERHRALLEAQLDRLNQARDILMAAPDATAVTANPSPHLTLLSPEDLPDRMVVLLYQQGRQEGIHTLQIQGRDIVLGFENSFGARKYAQLLEQRGLPKPTTESFDTSEIVDFCQGSGLGLVIIPQDETYEPPQASTDYAKEWDHH
jgi:hypothetical protein